MNDTMKLKEREAGISGAGLIGLERQRVQEVERLGNHHDDEHIEDELVRAAQAYLNHVTMGGVAAQDWPFELTWWKPTSRRACLIKAGQFIAAELEREDRIHFGAAG